MSDVWGWIKLFLYIALTGGCLFGTYYLTKEWSKDWERSGTEIRVGSFESNITSEFRIKGTAPIKFTSVSGKYFQFINTTDNETVIWPEREEAPLGWMELVGGDGYFLIKIPNIVPPLRNTVLIGFFSLLQEK